MIAIKIWKKVHSWCILAWNRALDLMRIKIKVSWLWVVDIFISNKIKSHVISASSNAHVLLNSKELLGLFQIILVDVVKTQSYRYEYKNRTALNQDVFYLIQEYGRIQADICFKIFYWINLIAYVPQHDWYHLRSIPLSWLNAYVFMTLIAYIMNSKWTLLECAIILEHLQNFEISLSYLWINQHVRPETFVENVPLDGLKEYHLTCS
jgi:hypothetical protein